MIVQQERDHTPRIERAFRWAYEAFQPSEGWLAVVLVATLIMIVTQTVAETEWVDLDLKLSGTALLAALLALIVAKQSFTAWRAWGLILTYGVIIIPLRLGDWWPPLMTWFDGLEAASAYARPEFAVFVNRLSIWAQRIAVGQASQEVLPFALAVAFLAWICAAFLSWSTFRTNRPLPALTVLGSTLAVNSYFSGQTDTTAIVLFLFIAFALVALVRWSALEQFWSRSGVDYSDELGKEFAFIVGLLAAALPVMSFWLPPLSLAAIGGRFAESAVVERAEDWLERAFGGVNDTYGQGRGGLFGSRLGGEGGQRHAGILPRAYLIGNAPELYETVMMTTTVQIEGGGVPRTTHWRALSYDNYSGVGWWRSESGERDVPTNATLDLVDAEAVVLARQQVHWVADDRIIRYTYGVPQSFDQPITAFWAGDGDLSHVRGAGTRYEAVSRVSIASAEMLRQVTLDAVPPLINATYTQLPDSVPERVHQLAADITANAATPFDKARAIEAFVRQYTYSLDVAAPPTDQDVADFFLFEQQAGYCDYFATAMTVLARSVGLPARIAIGFNAQPADANGVQTIYEINGHSWTEIYFEGYGWIEFEPTPAFSAESGAAATALEAPPPELAPIPEPTATAPIRVPRVAGWLLLAVAFTLLIVWLRRPLPSLSQRYDRLYRLSDRLPIRVNESQTPFEFEQRVTRFLAEQARENRYLQGPVWQRRFKNAEQVVSTTVSAFVAQQYAGDRISAEAPLEKRKWRGLNWLFVLLRWLS